MADVTFFYVWDYIYCTLAILILMFYSLVWQEHLLAICYGIYKFRHKIEGPSKSENLPGVSIMKPLKGVDMNLYENLESYFHINYPKYEILFCIQEKNDPAVKVVKSLISKYPLVDARLFCGGRVVCTNPKISNLNQGYDSVKYGLILISDCSIKTTPNALYDMVSHMTGRVGLVHQMPFTADKTGFSGQLEKVYFGMSLARGYLYVNFVGLNCVTGMSCLMKKSVIDECGGLLAFGSYVAEDYFMSKAFLDKKHLSVVSREPAFQNTANYSVGIWKRRVIRWAQLRTRQTPISFIEPIAECFLVGLFVTAALYYYIEWYCFVFPFVHVVMWYIFDYILLVVIERGKSSYNIFTLIPAWFFREAICYYIFIKGVVDSRIVWKDTVIRIKWGGLSELISTTNQDLIDNVNLNKTYEKQSLELNDQVNVKLKSTVINETKKIKKLKKIQPGGVQELQVTLF